MPSQNASLLVPCSVFNGYNVTNEHRTRDEKTDIREGKVKGSGEERRLMKQDVPLIFCMLHFDNDLTKIRQEKIHRKK